jgi:hypothetical protein
MAVKAKSKRTGVAEKSGNKKQQKKKIILWSVGLGAAGVLGYFGWQYFKKKKAEKKNDDVDLILNTNTNTPINHRVDTPVFVKPKITKPKPVYQPSYEPTYVPSIPKNTDDFPLKKGSKGDKVKLLQHALIDNNGKSILPRYGADGFFGNEMLIALKKLNLPSTVSETTFNVLVKGSNTSATKEDTGKLLYMAAAAKNFNKVIEGLKKLRNKDDYAAASESFKNYRLNGGVRQTLVNGMLNSFADEKQKQQIRLQFTRMGLQYDGNKWSLSGLDGLALITTQPTMVWKDAQTGVQVPANMVLGNEVANKLSYTLFENGGQHYLVKTSAIKYL